MTKSLIGSGVAITLLSASLIFCARPSAAEPLTGTSQDSLTQRKSETSNNAGRVSKITRSRVINSPQFADDAIAAGNDYIEKASALPRSIKPVQSIFRAAVSPQSFVATAYSLRGRTASGRFVTKGIIAADRRVLPLGTRVRLHAGAYSGDYLVADTGGAIRGRKIDIWVPYTHEAMRFGRRTIKLTVLSHGPRRGTRKAVPALR